ncbi:hypothetical protein BvCmsOUNP025_03955 [Escherichia coli]|nr:hypothetical protein BvCmsOUNP025_03955 [Escherichia coli]
MQSRWSKVAIFTTRWAAGWQNGWPDVTPPGHTEQATPVGAPMRTPAEPWTMLPPYCVMSP